TLVIDYISVEINHLPEGPQALRRFLEMKGYDFLFNQDIDAFYKRRT
ncbi:unnamed protein product, partial [Allacma fusca]